jgi:SagB-type dehydrogenase family enzyme
MRRFIPYWLLLTLIILAAPALPGCTSDKSAAPEVSNPAIPLVKETQAATATIKLSEPRSIGEMSLEEAIAGRRSVSSFTDTPITLQDLSQILWSGQGITDSSGKRAAPSAMRSYPLTIYIISVNITGLGSGVYKYVPDGHQLVIIKEGEIKENVMPNNAPVYLAITADSTGMVKKVGDIGKRFAYLEAGHAAQNICLQATSLGLATVTAAGFQEATLRAILALPDGPELLYIMPVGEKAS